MAQNSLSLPKTILKRLLKDVHAGDNPDKHITSIRYIESMLHFSIGLATKVNVSISQTILVEVLEELGIKVHIKDFYIPGMSDRIKVDIDVASVPLSFRNNNDVFQIIKFMGEE